MIQTADARLLMLVEADCMRGEPGAIANGGGGGAGGAAGSGGDGGPGGESGPPTTSNSGETVIAYRGHYGQGGRSGDRGRSGACGLDSRNGKNGVNGGILWEVKNGGKILRSSTRYEARVENLKVIPALNDGIFEPNGRIIVSGVQVHNTGGLDIPAGASAFIPSSETIKFESRKPAPSSHLTSSFPTMP